jgi:glycosyltransferase involved in cell wall biosynthesis
MKPTLSIAIPAHNEERFIARCIESVARSAQLADTNVEIVVALNRCTDGTQAVAESLGARCVVNNTRCIAAVRNAAVRASTAPAVATIDADSWMAPGAVSGILRKVHDTRYIGGGTFMRPERMSLGIFFSTLVLLRYILKHRVPSAGMFWFSREAFDTVGGFDESLVSGEDVDFAFRLRALGRARGRQYGTLWRHGITTSCRKFDKFGDWHLFREPDLLKQLLGGKNPEAASRYYYDADR